MTNELNPRDKAREEVRGIWARAPTGPPTRECANCGATNATYRAFCPACGKRYDRRLPWLHDRMRWVLAGVAVVVAATAAALILPGVFESKREGDAERARERAQTVAAERQRLIREQRPHRGSATELRPSAGASDSETLAARRGLMRTVEAAILADARGRAKSGALKGPVARTECGPLDRSVKARDENDLSLRIGRFDCTAVTSDIVRDGEKVGTLGHPFVATVDFKRFTYVWCKDNKAPGEGGKALVHVPLDRACLGAEGAERVGSGYAKPDDR